MPFHYTEKNIQHFSKDLDILNDQVPVLISHCHNSAALKTTTQLKGFNHLFL